MGLLGKDKRDEVRAIKRKTLTMILESAKSQHPEEFGALMRVVDDEIGELVLLPGTISGGSHAIFHLSMLPIDYTIIGSAHSHPSGNCLPSEADIEFFRRSGRIHIIVCYPYTMNNWAAYDIGGNRIELEVL